MATERQGSANQLNPVFLSWEVLCDLEVHGESGRDAYVVLRSVEQVRVDIVSLDTQGKQANQFVIDAAADCGCECGVRSTTVYVDVAGANQEFGEGADLSNRDRRTRSEQVIMFCEVVVDSDAIENRHRTGREILRAIVATKISDHSDEGQELAFDRAIPSVKAGPLSTDVGVVVGISEKDVTRSRDLSCCEGTANKNQKCSRRDLAHEHPPSASLNTGRRRKLLDADAAETIANRLYRSDWTNQKRQTIPVEAR